MVLNLEIRNEVLIFWQNTHSKLFIQLYEMI
jgi:hypothetical protein